MNPLSDFISDETFNILSENHFINEFGVRDYIIRKKFKMFRSNKLKSEDAVEEIRKDYPHLQHETIRKILFMPNRRKSIL